MVVYLVRLNIPNKKAVYVVYLVSLVLWSSDHTVKLKLSEVLFIQTIVPGILHLQH